MHLKLHPGETIRSPRILQLYWSGNDPWRGYNQFRRVMFAHVMPRIGGQLVVPPIAHLSTSFYELNESTEANVLSHLESAKGLGFEVFWLDAYWIKGGFRRRRGQLRISDRARRAARSFSSRSAADQRRRPPGRHEVPVVVRAGAGQPRTVSGQGASRVGHLARRRRRRALQPGNSRGPGVHDQLLGRGHQTIQDGLAADRLQHRSARLLAVPRQERPRPRRHGRNSLHRRAVPPVGRSEGRISATGHRRLRQRRPAHRPGNHVAIHSAMAQRQHLRHARPQAADRRTGGDEEPDHDCRTEPLRAVQHVWPNGRRRRICSAAA